jgi:hypothetical protein
MAVPTSRGTVKKKTEIGGILMRCVPELWRWGDTLSVVGLNKLRVYFSWTAVSNAESRMFTVSGVLK